MLQEKEVQLMSHFLFADDFCGLSELSSLMFQAHLTLSSEVKELVKCIHYSFIILVDI